MKLINLTNLDLGGIKVTLQVLFNKLRVIYEYFKN